MAAVAQLYEDFYQWTLDVRDPRVYDRFLLTSHKPVICIIILYLSAVLFGPRLMRNREPFNLKQVIVVYNLASVVVSIYMVYENISVAYQAGYNWRCEPVDYSNDPLSIRMLNVFYLYFLAKISEILDTTFFILRKKDRQITFLHVYHHSTMVVNGYLGAKYVGGGIHMYWACLNDFVHVIMYTYYGLSAMGPHMQKYLGWKRYLTQLQLTQMFLFLSHTTYILIYQPECTFPKGYNIWMLIYSISLATLFANFYIKSYTAKSKPKAE